MPSGMKIRCGWPGISGAPAWLALVSFAAHAGGVAEIGIADYRFTPAEISIRVGDSVRWLNHERRTSHSVVFPADGGRESDRLFPGESWQRSFDAAGRYEYHCGPHPEMKGIVVVAE